MSKRKQIAQSEVVPSPLEEHLGEIWDPRGHESAIAEANSVLLHFVEEMNAGRLPKCTIDQVRHAAGTLGHYSGYTEDACKMECFLDSPLATSSYQEVANSLPQFMKAMNALIQVRIAKLEEVGRGVVATAPIALSDDELPF